MSRETLYGAVVEQMMLVAAVAHEEWDIELQLSASLLQRQLARRLAGEPTPNDPKPTLKLIPGGR